MSKKEELKPVDFSFLQRKSFTFIAGSGSYEEHRVCIMNALYLATEIAAGRVTLEEAISPESSTDGVAVEDSVSCVSDVLTRAVIFRNDLHYPDKERKKWALALLPRLLGTKMSYAIENKAQREATRLLTAYYLEQAKNCARKFADTGKEEEFESAESARNMYAMGPTVGDACEDRDALDYVIEGLLLFFEGERKKIAARKGAKR